MTLAEVTLDDYDIGTTGTDVLAEEIRIIVDGRQRSIGTGTVLASEGRVFESVPKNRRHFQFEGFHPVTNTLGELSWVACLTTTGVDGPRYAHLSEIVDAVSEGAMELKEAEST
ncbi:hypothetical protein [Haloferax sulfurifontis]|uniref:Uncharacterized protein n=2 Tax=Haloferax sulfurifontis TaxID=255616 RepID=M0IM89_9EURY|nr:hypothetical protein [Haloferax sulfurifontis]ELZ96559.1 hypothetical protein C441_04304 [Haloferax sulfurifontis ATCC BAA-897]GGC72893.1 hypothetical protein GCM10007209_38560 [Haloferax sulfurifontis]